MGKCVITITDAGELQLDVCCELDPPRSPGRAMTNAQRAGLNIFVRLMDDARAELTSIESAPAAPLRFPTAARSAT